MGQPRSRAPARRRATGRQHRREDGNGTATPHGPPDAQEESGVITGEIVAVRAWRPRRFGQHYAPGTGPTSRQRNARTATTGDRAAMVGGAEALLGLRPRSTVVCLPSDRART